MDKRKHLYQAVLTPNQSEKFEDTVKERKLSREILGPETDSHFIRDGIIIWEHRQGFNQHEKEVKPWRNERNVFLIYRWISNLKNVIFSYWCSGVSINRTRPLVTITPPFISYSWYPSVSFLYLPILGPHVLPILLQSTRVTKAS